MTEIIIKEYPAQTIACKRYTGRYTDCGSYYGGIYEAIGGAVSGEPSMMLCYDSEYKPDGADIEVAVPVKSGTVSDKVEIRELPACRACSMIHKGSYDNLHKTYGIVYGYMTANRYKALIPSREVYIKGSDMFSVGNPEEYVTEVIVPIER